MLLGRLGELDLVDAAAGEDRHLLQSALIEDAPHALRQRDQVAAVEPHAANGDAGSLEAGREGDDLSCRFLGVVGVDQQDQVLGPEWAKASNAASSLSKAWMNEWAMVP